MVLRERAELHRQLFRGRTLNMHKATENLFSASSADEGLDCENFPTASLLLFTLFRLRNSDNKPRGEEARELFALIVCAQANESYCSKTGNVLFVHLGHLEVCGEGGEVVSYPASF